MTIPRALARAIMTSRRKVVDEEIPGPDMRTIFIGAQAGRHRGGLKAF